MKKIYLALLVFVTMLSVGVFAQSAQAANVTGWAWSPNIGWLSFSPSNSGSLGGNYGVTLSTSTGAFGGYAWSSNVGWVSFNASDTTSCPVGSCPPMVNTSTGVVSGWARLLSDGAWIQLAGTNHPSGQPCTEAQMDLGSCQSGITYEPSSGNISGFAYEPTEIGWMSFVATVGSGTTATTSATLTGACTISSTVTDPVQGYQTVTFQGTPNGANTVGQYHYSWDGGVTYGSSGNTTITYTSSSNGPGMRIRDEGTPPTASSVIPCPSVTVNATPVDLGVYVGKTGPSAASTTYQVSQGSTFGIKMIDNLSQDPNTGYSCSNIVPSATGSNNWSNWGNANGPGINTVDNLSTSGVTPGPYVFKTNCSNNADGTVRSASATLRIVSSHEGEI